MPAAVRAVGYRKIKFLVPATHMVAYERVSTAEQAVEGAGLAAQHTAIQHEANYKGLTIVRTCQDPGVSGKDMNRPGLTEALGLIAAGEAHGIIVSKLDRLSRSLLDFSSLMEQARKEGWNIIALDLGLDLSTPTGEMMANILATFAQFERRVIGQRTKDGLAEKRAAGVRLGRPGQIPAAVLRFIAAGRADNISFQKLADLLNKEDTPTPQGGKVWYAGTVRGAFLSQDMALLAEQDAA